MQRKSHSHLAAGALCDRRYLGEEGKGGVKVDEVDEVDEEEVGEEEEEEVGAAAVLRSGGLPSRAKKCARTRCLSTP